MIEEEIHVEKEDIPAVSFMDGIIARFQSPEFKRTILSTIVSIILALLVAAAIMVFTGYNPIQAFGALFLGGILQFDKVLYLATPYTLAGLSVALAFKCGLFNIGAEGQLYMGSLAATAVGYMISLPVVVHQLAALVVGVLVGMAYGFIPGLLKAYRGAHEVVTTMMLSYAAVLFTQWMVSNGPMHNPGDSRSVSPFILESAELFKLLGSSFLNAGFIIALVAVLFVWFLIDRTVMGYELRAVGSNEEAARTAGINSKKNMALALGLSGGLAGLAGSQEVLGYYHRFYDGWSAGLGFDGITVAVLGRNNPFGVLGGALFFGFLKAGGGNMQTFAGVPSEMVNVIQGLVVLFVAAPRLVSWLANHGVSFAQNVQENPSKAAPKVVALGYAVFSIIFALLGFNLILVGNAIISLFAVAYLYMRDDFGFWLVFISGLAWVLSAVMSIAGNIMLGVTQLAIGVFAIIVFVWNDRMKWSEKDPQQGGDFQ